MRWHLRFNRQVVQYLISLREAGHDIRVAIFSLANTKDGIPEPGATQSEPGLYVWEVAGHTVAFERFEKEKYILVTAVRPLRQEEEE